MPLITNNRGQSKTNNWNNFADLTRFATGVRRHWSIENQQHWVLDVQFGEDGNRARKDHSAENLALIRRTALNLLRNNGPTKDSLKRRKNKHPTTVFRTTSTD